MSDSVRVLVVDDAPAVRLLLSRTLPFHGIGVIGEAATADEAVRLAAATQPDVVLLDVHLPGRSGIDALETIRLCAPNAKIVMFSNDDAPELVEAALRAGASAYIPKIALIPDIAREIERVARSRRQAADSASAPSSD